MKVSAKNAPFSLWGGCSYCNQQDKNDPGMRVSEAVTRDASASWAISGALTKN
jgi:hypothetical protein